MDKSIIGLSYNFAYICCSEQRFYIKQDYATNCMGLHCYKCNKWVKWVDYEEQEILEEKYNILRI